MPRPSAHSGSVKIYVSHFLSDFRRARTRARRTGSPPPALRELLNGADARELRSLLSVDNVDEFALVELLLRRGDFSSALELSLLLPRDSDEQSIRAAAMLVRSTREALGASAALEAVASVTHDWAWCDLSRRDVNVARMQAECLYAIAASECSPSRYRDAANEFERSIRGVRESIKRGDAELSTGVQTYLLECAAFQAMALLDGDWITEAEKLVGAALQDFEAVTGPVSIMARRIEACCQMRRGEDVRDAAVRLFQEAKAIGDIGETLRTATLEYGARYSVDAASATSPPLIVPEETFTRHSDLAESAMMLRAAECYSRGAISGTIAALSSTCRSPSIALQVLAMSGSSRPHIQVTLQAATSALNPRIRREVLSLDECAGQLIYNDERLAEMDTQRRHE